MELICKSNNRAFPSKELRLLYASMFANVSHNLGFEFQKPAVKPPTYICEQTHKQLGVCLNPADGQSLHEQIAGEAVWDAVPPLLNTKLEQSEAKQPTIKAPQLVSFPR